MKKIKLFGNGTSAKKIINFLKDKNIWKTSIQKKFHND